MQSRAAYYRRRQLRKDKHLSFYYPKPRPTGPVEPVDAACVSTPPGLLGGAPPRGFHAQNLPGGPKTAQNVSFRTLPGNLCGPPHGGFPGKAFPHPGGEKESRTVFFGHFRATCVVPPTEASRGRPRTAVFGHFPATTVVPPTAAREFQGPARGSSGSCQGITGHRPRTPTAPSRTRQEPAGAYPCAARGAP